MNAEKENGKIPEQGISESQILKDLRSYCAGDVRWKEGKVWSLIYHLNDNHDRLLKLAYEEFFSSNYLNPFAFRSLLRMEKEVVRMTASLLHGDEAVCGSMTSGGTESILLAVYTCREYARKEWPYIKNPEIVVPASIHPAFDKATHLFGLHIKKVPLNYTQQLDPRELDRRISKNTIMLAVSAPNYPFGTLDPVKEAGRIALKHKLPLHVDACLGGFMLPWLEKLGIEISAWDFRVNGVTSISADLHKFGYSAKGASVLLFRNMELMRHQFYINTEFPGGIYATPTMYGTRSGGNIAAAWAALKHLGVDGYLKHSKELMEGALRFRSGIGNIPQLEVLGEPCMNVFAIRTRNNQPDIYQVADILESNGWVIDRQQSPESIHITLLPINLPSIDSLVSDLACSIEYLAGKKLGDAEGSAALYGLMARIPLRGIVRTNVQRMLENLYGRATEDEAVATPTSRSPKWVRFLNKILTKIRLRR